jgi:hypothetical protein
MLEVLDEKEKKDYVLFLMVVFLVLAAYLFASQFPLSSVRKFSDRDGNVLEIKTTLDLKD